MITRTSAYDSPVGTLYITASDEGVHAIGWPEEKPGGPLVSHESHPHLLEAVTQLRDYFAGRRTQFALPLRPRGTPFQRQVWNALQTIPHGHTTTYAAIARALGNPAAVRAVGAANSKNPLPIVIPCHRVVGSNGTLTGFAGGLTAKRFLLELEGNSILVP